MSDYNGYKNRATWNIALWLNNDYNLYTLMVEYMRHIREDLGGRGSYTDFIRWAGIKEDRTPDGFRFNGKALDRKELTEMIREN